MEYGNTVLDRIRAIVFNLLSDKELELVDLTFKREGGSKVLRITADKKGGITVDECAEANGLISQALDEADFINEPYLLEVLSPGLDRPLKTKEDFKRAVGKRIRIYTYVPFGGARDFTGELISADGGTMTVNTGKEDIRIEIDKISKATMAFEF